MGEEQNRPLQLSFNASMKIGFQGSRVTSSRKGKNTQLSLADLLRQSVYSRIAGFEDPRTGPSGSRKIRRSG
ncbi:MAG: hypothetical protein ABSE56_23480 [Bryobacteraceae bacterium]|jgi:hypothetical protein